METNKKNFDLLLDILELFAHENIPVIPFKGFVFAKLAYNSLSLRNIGDIDLLVKPTDFLRAKDLLIRNGFASAYFGHAEVSTVQAQLNRVKDDRLASADLHYRITPQYHMTNMDEAINGSDFDNEQRNRSVRNRTYWYFSFPIEPLWERAGTVEIEGKILPVFSNEDSLIVAVIHGCKENWRNLTRISDIAALVESSPQLDWHQISEIVDKFKFNKKFYLGIRLARDYLDLQLPDDINQKISRFTSKSIARQIIYRIGLEKYSTDQEEFRRLVSLQTMDSFREVITYMIYILRTPRDNRDRPVSRNNFFGFSMKLLSQMFI